MKQFALFIIGIITGLLSSCGEGNVSGGEEIHFSQEQNWTGEPAGWVYHNGKYHLFYVTRRILFLGISVGGMLSVQI